MVPISGEATSASDVLTSNDYRLPGVIEGGQPGRTGHRKPEPNPRVRLGLPHRRKGLRITAMR